MSHLSWSDNRRLTSGTKHRSYTAHAPRPPLPVAARCPDVSNRKLYRLVVGFRTSRLCFVAYKSAVRKTVHEYYKISQQEVVRIYRMDQEIGRRSLWYKKMPLYILVRKHWSMFRSLSLLYSAALSRFVTQYSYWRSHHNFNVLLHYLGKYLAPFLTHSGQWPSFRDNLHWWKYSRTHVL